jgi:hypothetical protein
MGSAEPSHGRSQDGAPEPAAPQAAPAPPRGVASIISLQRSAGNAAVARLVGGRSGSASAPRPPRPTAGDGAILARIKDTARARSALAPPPMHPADRAAAGLAAPIHPADLAAADLDRPRPHRPPAPAAAAPAPAAEAVDQLAELRARAPQIAREILDGAIGVRGQVPAYRRLAEQRLPAEEQEVTEVLQQATGAEAAARALAQFARVRLGVLASTTETLAIVMLTWEQLSDVGALEKPGFSAGDLIRDVRGAIKGWGTDEARLFKAIEGHTPLQLAAMRKAYRATYDEDMDEEIAGDLGGSEKDRAEALLTGDPILGAVATLRDAMDGAGTDEETIMRTLRGRPPAERAKIVATYEQTYHRPLAADLESEMGGAELGQANALLEGDTVKADAMALKDAMEGAGTDEPEIHAVYARIRDEVEAEAAAKGWKTAQVQAEVKRRTAELKAVYDRTFNASLEKDFDSELSGGDLNLALAEQAGDQTGIDAATLQIEHLSAWTSDDKVNEVLKAQYQRAEREVMRDLSVDFQRQAAHLPREQRAAAWKALQERGRELAQTRAKDYMKDLRASYDRISVATGFDALIGFEVSGYSRDEARERIDSGGKLSDAKELKYAIFGLGTNEKNIRETLKGKSKAELKTISEEYELLTGNDLLSDLEGDLAGRDEADMTLLLQTGDATPEERAAYLDKRTRWELGAGTGGWGWMADREEAHVLEASNREAQAALAQYQQLEHLPEDDPRRKAAQARLERWLGYGDKDIERHREELDSVTDTIAMVGAITVGIAATALTGGTAGVALLAAYFGTSTAVVAAGVGAIAAAGASMIIKEHMKGEAYGGEEIAADVATQTANAVVMVATAGMGEAAIQALARTPAFAVLARAASGGTLGRLAVKGAGSGIEGLIQGLPTGMMSAILNENTWRSPNPLAVILEAGGKSAVQTAAMSAGMSVGIHGVQAGVRGIRGAEPVAPHELAEPGAPEPGAPEPDLERRADSDDGELDLLIDDLDNGSAATGEVPVSDLEDGAIIDRDPPLTVAEAERIYDKTIADSPGREAMVWVNLKTGERIVIQGNANGVKPSVGALLELFRDAGKRGPWRPVRHYHGVGADGLTPMKYRYPSGIGGDMAGAKSVALTEGRMHLEVLDIVTENGREKVYFGYDPEFARYFAGRPTKGAPAHFEYFNKLDEYHDWVERESGERLSVLGGREPANPRERFAGGDPPSVDEGWDSDGAPDPGVDPAPDLPVASDAHKAAELLRRYPTADHVRRAVIERLAHAAKQPVPESVGKVAAALKALPKGVNRRVAELLPIVAEGIRNPALYAEVIVDAFEAMRVAANANPDVNRALLQLARADGHGVKVVPREYGTLINDFWGDHASTPFHIVDLPFLGGDHGAMTHVLQDLVVNKAFEAAGIGETSAGFRALLGRCEGFVDNLTYEVFETEKPYSTKLGAAVWESTYDITEDVVNRPEVIRPILRDLFGLQ